MIAWLAAKSVNLSYSLGLPVPLRLQIMVERWLWNNPSQIKVFLNLVTPAALWKMSENKLVAVVRYFIRETPALKKRVEGCFPKGLRTFQDFKDHMPVLDKASYVKTNTLVDLCRGGRIPRAGSLYKSAGTSGQPTIWADSVEEQLAFDKTVGFIGHTLLDMFGHDYFIVNCWVMGSWLTGGNFASSARFYGAIINIGTLLEEATETIRSLGPSRRMLLAGYPPFIFSLLQRLEAVGVNFSDYHFDVVVGGEGFVEEWRDALIRKLGKKSVIFSVYGSSDKGLGEGIESHLAYAVRTLFYVASLSLIDAKKADEVWRLRSGEQNTPFKTEASARAFLSRLLGEDLVHRLPMVFQFDPSFYYNENRPTDGTPGARREFASTVLVPLMTIPRVRYNIHDEGFIVTYDEVRRAAAEAGLDWNRLNLRKDPHFDLHLPFLFIFGRTDGTVSIDGANIFPQDVERTVREDAGLSEAVYGFQLFVTDAFNLGVALELRAGTATSPEIRERARIQLDNRLPTYSSGFAELRRDKLPSAVLTVETHPFNTGPFANRRVKTAGVRAPAKPQ